jgi:hypothetical protein
VVTGRHVAPLWHIILILNQSVFSGEATNSNFIIFGLTRSGLEPTMYCTRGEHVNHYDTDAIIWRNSCTIADLTVFNFFSVRHYEKRFNAKNWIWTSAEFNIQWLLFFFSLFTILHEFLVTTSIKQKLVLCDFNLYFPSQCISYQLNLY